MEPMERSTAKDYALALAFAVLALAIIAVIVVGRFTFDMSFSSRDPLWAVSLFCAPLVLFWVLVAAALFLPPREPSKGACLCFLAGLLPGCVAIVISAMFLFATWLMLPFVVTFVSVTLLIWWQGVLALLAARKKDGWTGQVPKPTGWQALVVSLAVLLLLTGLKLALAPKTPPEKPPAWQPGAPVEAEDRAR